MTNILMFIPLIMKCQKENKKIEVLLKNNQKLVGYIQKYNGQELVVDGMEISIHDMEAVQEVTEIDLSSYVMNRILIDLISGEQVDAVLISSTSKEIQVINDQGAMTLSLEEITKIVCNDEVIWENASPQFAEREGQLSETIEYPEEDGVQRFVLEKFQTEDGKERNMLVFYEEEINQESDVAESMEEQQEIATEITVELADGTIYVPNAFEQALITGNKEEVEEFLAKPQCLLDLGYTEKEAERFEKILQTTPWGMDPYRIATRIFQMQVDKNDLARVYFEQAYANIPKSNADYKKLLIHMSRYRLEDGEEAFLGFWK